MSVCSMDCLNCPFEDCINDEMTAKEYYEANREKILAQQREYRKANREMINESARYGRERNKRIYAEICRKIRAERLSLGLTQREVAEICGISIKRVGAFEVGTIRPRVDLLAKALPGLLEEEA